MRVGVWLGDAAGAGGTDCEVALGARKSYAANLTEELPASTTSSVAVTTGGRSFD